MAAPSVSYSITVRLELPARPTAVSELTTVIERAGGIVTALDVTASGPSRVRVDVTCAAGDSAPMPHGSSAAEGSITRVVACAACRVGGWNSAAIFLRNISHRPHARRISPFVELGNGRQRDSANTHNCPSNGARLPSKCRRTSGWQWRRLLTVREKDEISTQASRHLDQRGDPRGVVHRAVVQAIAVDRCADAHMIEMCGQDDVLAREGGIAAWQQRGDVIGLDGCRLERDARTQRCRERKARQRLPGIGNRQQLRERMA